MASAPTQAVMRCMQSVQQQRAAVQLLSQAQALSCSFGQLVDHGVRKQDVPCTPASMGAQRPNTMLQPATAWPAASKHVLRTWSQNQQHWATSHIQRLAFSTAPQQTGQSGKEDSSKSQPQPSSVSSTTAADPLWTLPNMLSLGRAVSGPYIAYLIVTHEYQWALGAVVISGLTDWADGAAARALGQNSVLGSYLDPLADKVLVGCVAGALGSQGLIPSWLAALVIGRDVGLVTAAFWARWRMLGYRVRGVTAAEFFNTVPTRSITGAGTPEGGEAADTGAGAGSGTAGVPQAVMSAPPMRPLMISKVNTVFQLALIAGCLSSHAASWPAQDVLDILEVTTAATTVASFTAYAVRAASGKWHGNGK